jgi:hypothetical protein
LTGSTAQHDASTAADFVLQNVDADKSVIFSTNSALYGQESWLKASFAKHLVFSLGTCLISPAEGVVDFTGSVYSSIVGGAFFFHPSKTTSDGIIVFYNNVNNNALTGDNYLTSFREASPHSTAQTSGTSSIYGFQFQSSYYRGSTSVQAKTQRSFGVEFTPNLSLAIRGGTSIEEYGVYHSTPAMISNAASAATCSAKVYTVYGDHSEVTADNGTIEDYGAYFIGGLFSYDPAVSTQIGIYLKDYGVVDTDTTVTQYGIFSEGGGDWVLGTDDQKLWFGGGLDASLRYNGTDLVLNTAEVGSGVLKFAASSNWSSGGASAGTLGNAPSAGNPSKWLVVKDSSGNTLYIPAWA